MLRVNLPEGFKTPPAFTMLGEHGGMLSPYNDKIAICYLPIDDVAYIKDYKITNYFPHLPKDWNIMSRGEIEKRTQDYFNRVKQRFPVLKDATNPHLIIRDTLNFERDLVDREHKVVTEFSGDLPAKGKDIAILQEQVQMQIMDTESGVHEVEEPMPGLFALYPTKATYAPYAALQAVHMVEARTKTDITTKIVAPERRDTLRLILGGKEDEKQERLGKLKKYSLAAMPAPTPEEIGAFLNEHSDLSEDMLLDSWSETPAVSLAAKVVQSRNKGQRRLQ